LFSSAGAARSVTVAVTARVVNVARSASITCAAKVTSNVGDVAAASNDTHALVEAMVVSKSRVTPGSLAKASISRTLAVPPTYVSTSMSRTIPS
jgi:hypothetical protein